MHFSAAIRAVKNILLQVRPSSKRWHVRCVELHLFLSAFTHRRSTFSQQDCPCLAAGTA